MISVACPSCSTYLEAPPEALGRRVSCYQCGTKFELQEPHVLTSNDNTTPNSPSPEELSNPGMQNQGSNSHTATGPPLPEDRSSLNKESFTPIGRNPKNKTTSTSAAKRAKTRSKKKKTALFFIASLFACSIGIFWFFAAWEGRDATQQAVITPTPLLNAFAKEATADNAEEPTTDESSNPAPGTSDVNSSRVASLDPNLSAQAMAGHGILEKYCAECHNPDEQEGDFDLAFLGSRTNRLSHSSWFTVLESITAEDMPPEESTHPLPPELRAQLEKWIISSITEYKTNDVERNSIKHMRRLTSRQYFNKIETIFGTRHLIRSTIPDTEGVKARDNHLLSMSPEHINTFSQAAHTALANYIPLKRPELGNLSYTPYYTFRGKGAFGTLHEEKSISITCNANGKKGVHTAASEVGTPRVIQSGAYRVKVTCRAESKTPVIMGLAMRHNPITNHVASKTGTRLERELTVHPSKEMKVYEATVQMTKGEWVVVQKLSGEWKGGRKRGQGFEFVTDQLLIIQNIAIEGPLTEEWPPEKMKKLFGDYPENPNQDDVYKMLFHFAELAFFKPLTTAQEDKIRSFYRLSLKRPAKNFTSNIWEPQGSKLKNVIKQNEAFSSTSDWNIDSSIINTCIYIMISPEFLFQTQSPVMDDYDVAARISYLLWNAPPDKYLLDLAAEGKLSTRRGRDIAIDYCFDSANSQSFVQSFIIDWLDTDKVGEMDPDKHIFGKDFWHGDLLEHIESQSAKVFTEILREDHPIETLIQSNWTMVNDTLAKHYGIPGVTGAEFRKVTLDDQHLIRGSILGHAAIHQVLSDGSRSLPVARGVWVMENLLGMEVLPPPPNIPIIEPDTRGATTLVDQLKKHSEASSCKKCHEIIDPFGIALENFDALGGWRERYRVNVHRKPEGLPIDSKSKLPDGTELNGPVSLMEYLMKHEDDFAKCFTQKLFEFSLGRGLSPNELTAVTDVIEATETQQGGVRTLIKNIIQHPVYLK